MLPRVSPPDWSNKKVLVTGASGELGRAIALALHAAGAKVVAGVHRNKGPAQLPEVALDVVDEASVRRAFEAAGPLDVLVHVAGAGFFQPLDQTPLAEWKRLSELNLTGTFLCLREALLQMKPRGGRVLVVGSISATTPLRDNAAYGATKAGVRMLCAVLNEEGQDHRVRATHLAVGAVASPLLSQLKIGSASAPLAPEDVARAVLSVGAVPLEVRVDELSLLPGGGVLR